MAALEAIQLLEQVMAMAVRAAQLMTMAVQVVRQQLLPAALVLHLQVGPVILTPLHQRVLGVETVAHHRLAVRVAVLVVQIMVAVEVALRIQEAAAVVRAVQTVVNHMVLVVVEQVVMLIV
jgi:hypothetical protein